MTFARPLRIAVTLALATTWCWTSVRADVADVDTTIYWDGRSAMGPFGVPCKATVGQTFMADEDTLLSSFGFFVDDGYDYWGSFLMFDAYVMAWDGAKATGDVLFQSGPYFTSNNGGADGFEEFAIDTDELYLPAGNYVAFFSASWYFVQEPVQSMLGAFLGDVYPGGRPVAIDNGMDFDLITEQNWGSYGHTEHAFWLDFTPVPEPATLVLASGLLVWARAALRRTR